MHTNITRGQALNLLKKYNQEPFHLLHALTVEAVMRYLAVQLGYADEAEFWGLCGLLHDIDFEKFPQGILAFYVLVYCPDACRLVYRNVSLYGYWHYAV